VRIENYNKYTLQSLKITNMGGWGGQILENLCGHRVNFMGSSLLNPDRFKMLSGGWLNIYCHDVY